MWKATADPPQNNTELLKQLSEAEHEDQEAAEAATTAARFAAHHKTATANLSAEEANDRLAVATTSMQEIRQKLQIEQLQQQLEAVDPQE